MSWLDDAVVTTAADKAEQAKASQIAEIKRQRDDELNALTYTLRSGVDVQVRPKDLDALTRLENGTIDDWEYQNGQFERLTTGDVTRLKQEAKRLQKEVWARYRARIEAL